MYLHKLPEIPLVIISLTSYCYYYFIQNNTAQTFLCSLTCEAHSESGNPSSPKQLPDMCSTCLQMHHLPQMQHTCFSGPQQKHLFNLRCLEQRNSSYIHNKCDTISDPVRFSCIKPPAVMLHLMLCALILNGNDRLAFSLQCDSPTAPDLKTRQFPMCTT